MARMRWDKATREKLKKEAALYEQTAIFIMRFGLIGVRDVACANIIDILGELEDIIALSYSVVEDVPSMIDDRRSKVEKELIRICDQSYDDIKIKQAFDEFLVHFRQCDLKKYGLFSQYSPIDIIREARGIGKASQLTKLELQQQEDDDKVYMEKREKLNKESDDYEQTLLFMESFLYKEQLTIENQRNVLLYAYKNVLAVDHDLQYTIALGKELFTNKEQRDLLLCAYKNVLAVDRDLQYIIASDKELSEQELSSIVTEYRSKIENELQSFCDNVSNLTVKEAYARHLDDFKTGFKLSAQDHNSDLKNEDGKIMSSKPKMSVKKKKKKSKLHLRGKGRSGSCKTTTSNFDFHQQINAYFDRLPYHHVHDHSQCCKKKISVWNFDYMDSLPKEEEYRSGTRVCGL